MNENLNNINQYEDAIDIKNILSIIWKKKNIVIAITFVSAILSVAYSLSLPNIYKSNALLLPEAQEDSLSSKIGTLSPIASFAGITLPNNQVSKSKEAIERIKSFEFFSNFFLPNIKLENLMAVDKWLPLKNQIVYKKSLFDAEKNAWVRNVQYPYTKIPSDQEAYEVFKKILFVNEGVKTQFVNISIEHFSPYISQKWVQIIIEEINESMREEDKNNAKNSIDYLNSLTNSNNIQSINEVSFLLLEQQMQILMLASSNDNYIYKVIDPPIVPEIKIKPNRAIICIIGTFLGGIFSLFIAFLIHFRQEYNLL